MLGNNATGDLNQSRSQSSLSHTVCNARVQGKSVKGGMGEPGNGPGLGERSRKSNEEIIIPGGTARWL